MPNIFETLHWLCLNLISHSSTLSVQSANIWSLEIWCFCCIVNALYLKDQVTLIWDLEKRFVFQYKGEGGKRLSWWPIKTIFSTRWCCSKWPEGTYICGTKPKLFLCPWIHECEHILPKLRTNISGKQMYKRFCFLKPFNTGVI